jgi:serine protease Do
MWHASKICDDEQNQGRPAESYIGYGVVWLLVACCSTAVCAQEVDGLAVAAALENSLVNAISQAEHSVVSIARVKPSNTPRQSVIDNALHARNLFDSRNHEGPTHANFIPTDFGSGVIIGVDPGNVIQPRAYILTNYHVVKGGKRTIPDEAHPDEYELYVKLNERHVAQARIYAADPRSDLAVITISERDPLPLKLSDLKPIKLSDGAKLKKGQLVIALGNAYASARDGSASASWGMVSNLGRRPALPRSPADKHLETLHDLGDLIQVDTRLNIGTSGGALINLKGEMVGLTTSLAALAGFEKASGFALPVDAGMLRTIQSLREGKEVEYGFLGVSFPESPELFRAHQQFPEATNVPAGIADFLVLRGSPADQGGLRDNEVIVSINGERVFSPQDLTREINKHGPDARVRLTVWGKIENGTAGAPTFGTRIREVTLAKWGAYDEDSIIATNYRYPPWRGLVLDYSTARYKHNGEINSLPNGPPFPKGVLVLKLLPPLDVKQTDIVEGNRILKVNNTPVATPHEFLKAVRDLEGPVTLHLDNGKHVTVQELANPESLK